MRVLIVWMQGLNEAGLTEHPLKEVEKLGIRYNGASEVDTISECWALYDPIEATLPNPLPPYLTFIEVTWEEPPKPPTADDERYAKFLDEYEGLCRAYGLYVCAPIGDDVKAGSDYSVAEIGDGRIDNEFHRSIDCLKKSAPGHVYVNFGQGETIYKRRGLELRPAEHEPVQTEGNPFIKLRDDDET